MHFSLQPFEQKKTPRNNIGGVHMSFCVSSEAIILRNGMLHRHPNHAMVPLVSPKQRRGGTGFCKQKAPAPSPPGLNVAVETSFYDLPCRIYAPQGEQALTCNIEHLGCGEYMILSRGLFFADLKRRRFRVQA